MASPLQAYLRQEALTNAELRVVLLDAAEEAERLIPKLLEQGGIGGQLRAAQLSLVLREIRALMAALFGDIGWVVQEGRLNVAEAAARGEDVLLSYLRDNGLGKEAGVLLESFVGQAKAGFATIRAKAANGIPLSSQVYRTQALATGLVNRVVTRGLLLGHGAKEIARDVKGLISPNVRGGVSYAAKRLARTELNNAFRTAQEQRYADEPWTRGMRWNLSGSHPRRDVCNVNAEQDIHDLGAGVYRVGERPDSHPNCLCFLTPEQISEDAFIDGFLAGEYDDYLDGVDGGSQAQQGIADVIPINRKLESRKPSSASPPSSAVMGRDITLEVERVTKDGNVTNVYTEPADFSDPRDRMLADIGTRQGFSGLPGKGSIDREVAAGGVELWRGVIPFKGSKTVPAVPAEGVAGKFTDGEYEPGSGIYGNGYYFSTSRRVGEHYAEEGKGKRRKKTGVVQRVALRSGARVIDQDELVSLRDKWREDNRAQFYPLESLYANNFVTPDGFLSPHFTDNVMGDLGRFAALLGYDTIRITGKQDGAPYVKGEPSAKHLESGSRFSAHPQYIILNRTAVIVEA
jgi:hypothetical protein